MSEQQDQSSDGMARVHYDEPHDRRKVTIVAAKHRLGRDGICSCCRGAASVGVLASESGDDQKPHVFYCLRCAARIGAAGAKARELR